MGDQDLSHYVILYKWNSLVIHLNTRQTEDQGEILSGFGRHNRKWQNINEKSEFLALYFR